MWQFGNIVSSNARCPPSLLVDAVLARHFSCFLACFIHDSFEPEWLLHVGIELHDLCYDVLLHGQTIVSFLSLLVIGTS